MERSQSYSNFDINFNSNNNLSDRIGSTSVLTPSSSLGWKFQQQQQQQQQQLLHHQHQHNHHLHNTDSNDNLNLNLTNSATSSFNASRDLPFFPVMRRKRKTLQRQKSTDYTTLDDLDYAADHEEDGDEYDAYEEAEERDMDDDDDYKPSLSPPVYGLQQVPTSIISKIQRRTTAAVGKLNTTTQTATATTATTAATSATCPHDIPLNKRLPPMYQKQLQQQNINIPQGRLMHSSSISSSVSSSTCDSSIISSPQQQQHHHNQSQTHFANFMPSHHYDQTHRRSCPPRQLKHEESFDSNMSTGLSMSPLSPRHKFFSLQRDSSLQSDSSRYSSVDSLLESRKPDPEAILINLGFGPEPGSDNILSRIPKRFLKPSQVRGNDTDAFIRRLQMAACLADHSVLGYRGLTGNPDLPPSSIVATIMKRFEVNQRKKSLASTEHGIQ